MALLKKHKDCFRSKPLRDFMRELPCANCGAHGVQISHMVSVKWGDSSDALALQACPACHPQSTKKAAELMGDWRTKCRKTWRLFMLNNGASLKEQADVLAWIDRFEFAQQVFEEWCVVHGLGERADGSRRKNRKEFSKKFQKPETTFP